MHKAINNAHTFHFSSDFHISSLVLYVVEGDGVAEIFLVPVIKLVSVVYHFVFSFHTFAIKKDKSFLDKLVSRLNYSLVWISSFDKHYLRRIGHPYREVFFFLIN